MAGWGSDSFDTGAAGGWGDVSYSATEATLETSRTLDKVAIPVTIVDLNKNVSRSEEKITFNKASFSTVRTVGIVKSSEEQDGGQSVEYKIHDVANNAEEFLVIHYKGVNPSDIRSEVVAEGSMIVVVGKLRNFDNRLAIVAFDVKEILDKRELEAFLLESELAMIFYKELDGKIKNNPSLFENTMLRCNFETAQSQSNGVMSGSTWGQNTNGTNRNVGIENVKGLVGQKAAIYKYLSSLGSVEGATTDEIIKNIPKELLNRGAFAADFDVLLSEGHIYSTIDDDHFTAN